MEWHRGAQVLLVLLGTLAFGGGVGEGENCAGLMFGTFEENAVIMIMDRKAVCPGDRERKKILVIFEGFESIFPAHTEITLSINRWIDDEGMHQTSIRLIGRYLLKRHLYAYGWGKGDTKDKSFIEALINARESMAELLSNAITERKEARLRLGYNPGIILLTNQ